MNDQLLQLVFTQTWQIAVLAIAVAAVVRIAARNRPHLAHALWILVLIKCVTPPLWGHSLGVFSRFLAWTPPAEVAAPLNTQDALTPVDAADPVLSAGGYQMLLPAESQGNAELHFDAEAQRREVAEEAHIDLASLRLRASASEIPPLPPEQKSQAAEPASLSTIDTLRTLLLSGLIAGMILTLLTMVVRCLRCLRQIHRHRTTEFDNLLRERIQQLAKQLRMRRIPRIIVSDVLFGPAVLGFLRHTIVLPRCLFDSSRSFLPERTFAARRIAQEPTSAQRQNVAVDSASSGRVAARREVLPGRQDLPNLQFLDPILAHELLHIRRGDLRTGTLQAIVQSLWWFHPAVWFSNRWLSREAERCCDEQVIAELGCSPAQYARSLLSVIECKQRLQPIPVFPGMKPVEITTQRMERIMSLKNGLKKRTPLWCWLMIVALAFVVLPGAVAKSIQVEVKPESPSEQPATDTSPAVTEVENSHPTDQAATFERSVSPKWRENPGVAPKESAIVPDRNLPPAIQQSSDPLVKQVWQVRESIRKRLLSTYEYTPWQIMQGLNGLRLDFDLKHEGKVVNGLEWIQTGPMFEDEPWFQKTAHGGQAHPFTKPYAFQGHINQFAAILAMCVVPLDAQFGTPDGPITMADMVKHAQMTANETEEVCWTLQLLCKYLPPDSEWVNAKGEKWSMERLVKTTMLKATASGAPNGGTFGLFALAVARNEYRRTGKPLSGVWLDADKMIQQHIQIVRDQQNPNGTLSSNSFRSGDEKKDFNSRLASSGALLEFLLMAVSDEQLKEGWGRQAVAATVKDLDENRKSFVSCSSLFPAAHALGIYLDRITVHAVANIKPAPTAGLRNHSPAAGNSTSETKDVETTNLQMPARNEVTIFLTKNNSASYEHSSRIRSVSDFDSEIVSVKGIDGDPKQIRVHARNPGRTELQIKDEHGKVHTVVLVVEDKEPMAGNPLVLMTYFVADLVVPLPNVDAKVGRLIETNNDASRSIELATPVLPRPATDVSNNLRADARSATNRPHMKADFAPLIELIKATVEPDSWHKDGAVVVENPDTLSLVIRQTQKAHDQIVELLLQLRNAQDQNVLIQAQLLILTDDTQTKWLEENCSLHPLQNGNRWALLPQQRSESFTQSLMKLKPEVLSEPRALTVSGQTATIQIGGISVGENVATGIRLEVTPHLLPESKVIRLQHSFSVGTFDIDMPEPTESLVGSGQTLLVLVADSGNDDKSDAARPRY